MNRQKKTKRKPQTPASAKRGPAWGISTYAEKIFGHSLFPKDDPRYQIFETNAQQAGAEIAAFKAEHAQKCPAEPDGERNLALWSVDGLIGEFDIIAKTFLLMAQPNAEMPIVYEKLFARFVEEQIKRNTSAVTKNPALESVRTFFLTELQFRYRQRLAFWIAKAFELSGDSETDPKDTALEVRGGKTQRLAEQEPPSAQPLAFEAVTWEQIEISFLSDERIQIIMPRGTRTLNYAEFGFEDGRTQKPNRAWGALLILAKAQQPITESMLPSGMRWSNFEKRIEEIRRKLRVYCNLCEDPLPYLRNRGYGPRFRISCAPSFES